MKAESTFSLIKTIYKCKENDLKTKERCIQIEKFLVIKISITKSSYYFVEE